MENIRKIFAEGKAYAGAKKVIFITTFIYAFLFILTILLSILGSSILEKMLYSSRYSGRVFFIALGLILFGVVSNFIISFFIRNNNMSLLKSSLLATFNLIIWTSIITGFLFIFKTTERVSSMNASNNTFSYTNFLLISCLPLLILMVCATIGYFELINKHILKITMTLLGIALMVLFFVSFFVLKVQWYYSLLSVLFISGATIFEFYYVKKEIQNFTYVSSNSQIYSYAINLATRLFVSTSSMLIHILRLLSFSRDN
ncbi:MAG0110 family membrane protein [Mycoplasma sp. CSL7503-lung]|uniref:MAG0110 family membrane protein n=1 Tax=Mycoplasma sp. CSL7503-lung TaxID=536372 RepID=UPI0021D06FA1|nr:hypothetical protein [Mycoplasma sp. CSL7503-lung]MCU4706690.1 hypothetical protein [Mycoplasma sp. CSL7503-lung]